MSLVVLTLVRDICAVKIKSITCGSVGIKTNSVILKLALD